MVEPIPAIEGHWSEEDREVSVISTAKDTVSFIRGLGDSGRRIQVVEYGCPQCGHATMVREKQVYPEERDTVAYWCNDPHCQYHHEGAFAYAFRRVKVGLEPVISRYDR